MMSDTFSETRHMNIYIGEVYKIFIKNWVRNLYVKKRVWHNDETRNCSFRIDVNFVGFFLSIEIPFCKLDSQSFSMI